jgi:hypothetical protein
VFGFGLNMYLSPEQWRGVWLCREFKIQMVGCQFLLEFVQKCWYLFFFKVIIPLSFINGNILCGNLGIFYFLVNSISSCLYLVLLARMLEHVVRYLSEKAAIAIKFFSLKLPLQYLLLKLDRLYPISSFYILQTFIPNCKIMLWALQLKC